MVRPRPNQTPVFHILPIEKLRSVIEHGLLCDTQAARRFGQQRSVDAAHENLKGQRRRKQVPVARGGVMADYVPFYFAPRSPMLYSIKCGNTQYGRSGRGQAGMIHLVFHMELLVRDFAEGWCFIDAHLTRGWAQFGDTLAELDERIDFSVMKAKRWNTSDEVTAARQAEFLVHGVVPWQYVAGIVAISDEVAGEVEEIVQETRARHVLDVRARPPGYFPAAAFPYGYYYH